MTNHETSQAVAIDPFKAQVETRHNLVRVNLVLADEFLPQIQANIGQPISIGVDTRQWKKGLPIMETGSDIHGKFSLMTGRMHSADPQSLTIVKDDVESSTADPVLSRIPLYQIEKTGDGDKTETAVRFINVNGVDILGPVWDLKPITVAERQIIIANAQTNMLPNDRNPNEVLGEKSIDENKYLRDLATWHGLDLVQLRIDQLVEQAVSGI